MSEFVQDMQNIGTNAFEECGTDTEAAEGFIHDSVDGSSWLTWPLKTAQAFAETHGDEDPGHTKMSDLDILKGSTVYDVMAAALFDKAREIAYSTYYENVEDE